jgi:hypothetical protein
MPFDRKVELIGQDDRFIDFDPGTCLREVAYDAIERRFTIVESETAAVIDASAEFMSSLPHICSSV